MQAALQVVPAQPRSHTSAASLEVLLELACKDMRSALPAAQLRRHQALAKITLHPDGSLEGKPLTRSAL